MTDNPCQSLRAGWGPWLSARDAGSWERPRPRRLDCCVFHVRHLRHWSSRGVRAGLRGSNPLTGPLLMVVAMPGAGLDGAWIPEKYRPRTHICFPQSRKPCWCGAWHRSTDPADYLMAVGSPSREVRFASGVPGLAIVPEGARHPDGAFSSVAVPARDFALWALRAVEQIAEGLLVPGVIGYHFDDMTLMVGTGRRLQFSYAASATESSTRAHKRLPRPATGYPGRPTCLYARPEPHSFKLADLAEACHLARECGEQQHEHDVLCPDWRGHRLRDHGGVAWSVSPSDGCPCSRTSPRPQSRRRKSGR